jgi:hypothetical protein
MRMSKLHRTIKWIGQSTTRDFGPGAVDKLVADAEALVQGVSG